MARKENRRNILCILCFVTLIIIILLVVVIYLATRGHNCTDPEGKMTTISRELFGDHDGKEIYKYTIENKNKVKVQIINFGAAITNIFVPDKNGKLSDITLGYDKFDGYKSNDFYFGGIIGRYANRIANGTFEIDGTTYKLATNNGPNALHGGELGFLRRVWEASEDDGILAFKYVSPDMEEGYPGELTVVVTYMLTDEDELVIHFTATTTKSTIINLTNHAYFNLAGHESGDVLNHSVQLLADNYIPVNNNLIPTGEIATVQGTIMDLRTPTQLNDVISQIPGNVGFDYTYCFNNAGWKKLRAIVTEKTSGRKLEVYSTEPGMHFYSGFYVKDTGKGGAKYDKYSGLALEAHHYPDSPNHKNFPTVQLNPGETYLQTTSYKFSLL